MDPASIVGTAVSIIQGVISLASSLGQRDAVLAALDAVLATARHQTDVDLHRKHHPDDDGA